MTRAKNIVPKNHSIVFHTDDDGNLHATVEGVQGPGCDGLLEILEDLGVVLKEEKTKDWDRPEHQGRAVRPPVRHRAGS